MKETTLKRTAIMAALFALLIGLGLMLCACAPSGNEKAGYTFGFGSVEISGKTLTVNLECDHEAGHEWTDAIEGGRLTEASIEHSVEDSGVEYDVFTFTGTSAGNQTISFSCNDPANAGNSDESLTIEVTTDSSGVITATTTEASDGSGGSTK